MSTLFSVDSGLEIGQNALAHEKVMRDALLRSVQHLDCHPE